MAVLNAINQTAERQMALHYHKLSIAWLVRMQVLYVIWLALAKVRDLRYVLPNLIDKLLWLTLRLMDN